MKRTKTERGFTLLETIVALVIASAAMIIIIQAFAGGFRAKSSIDRQLMMARLAQSKLAEIEATIQPSPQNAQGMFDNNFGWRAFFEPYEAPANDVSTAYWVTVEVFPADVQAPPFALKTLILVENSQADE
jgi:prepilin-type N-terminal cleavage/methylation domain-containing protein